MTIFFFALLVPASGLPLDAPVSSVEWEVDVPVEFFPAICAEAAIRLDLISVERHMVSSFSPALESGSQSWFPEITEGSYSLIPIVTDCDGSTRELPGLSLEVSSRETRRRVFVIPRVGPGTFDLDYLDSCAWRQVEGLAHLAEDHMLIRNNTEQTYTVCHCDLGAHVGGKRIQLASINWRDRGRYLLPGEETTIDLAQAADWRRPVENPGRVYLELWVAAAPDTARDYGWHERKVQPFEYDGCCDALLADLTAAYRLLVRQREAVSPGAATTETMRAFEIVLSRIGDDEKPFPRTDGEVRTAESIAPFVEHGVDVSMRDGWGNEFLYWSDGAHYVLASPGPDGVWDKDYGAILARYARFDHVEGAICQGPVSRAGADYVLTDRGFCQRPSMPISAPNHGASKRRR